MNLLFFLILLNLFIFCNCASPSSKEVTNVEKTMEISQNPIESLQIEQISCPDSDCVTVYYNKLSEIDDKLGELINKNAGKILIDLYSNQNKLDSDKLEDLVSYLREIGEAGGQVAIEPLYIKERGIDKFDIPFIKDLGLTSFDIFTRIKNTIKYRNTKYYNAKIIYHPKNHNVLLAFFIHKSYGDICNTIYSNCKELEYLDDETFDHTLSMALKKSRVDKEPIKINFKQVGAKLFESKLDIDNFKKLNQSARLYKWLILSQKSINKPIRRERFLGVTEALTILDYSITLYDKYKEIKLYSPVRGAIAEVNYSGKEKGGSIESVVFKFSE
jgi:hypothetical protein